MAFRKRNAVRIFKVFINGKRNNLHKEKGVYIREGRDFRLLDYLLIFCARWRRGESRETAFSSHKL